MVKLTDLKPTAIAGPYNKAAEIYGVDDTIHTRIPRSKNQFEISFSTRGKREEFIFPRVAQVSLPTYDFNVQPLNQYNRIRYYPTAFRPQPITIVFYDTRDSEFQFILEEYARYYSHGLGVDPNVVYRYDTIDESFDRTFGIKAVNKAERYFIDKISIKTIDAKTQSGENSRTIDCYNCMIGTANHDTLDYSTANPVMWQVTFVPEHVNINSSAELQGQSSKNASGVINELRVGDIIYAVDEDGNFIFDTNGSPIILRIEPVPSTETVDLTSTVSEEGEVLVDENGRPL